MQKTSRNLVAVPIAVITIPQHGYVAVVSQWWATDGTNVFVLRFPKLSKNDFPLAYSSQRNATIVAEKLGISSVIQLPVAYIQPGTI